jgi:ADP-heptose:LPS heptosyltransferase
MFEIIDYHGPVVPPALNLAAQAVERAAERLSALFEGSSHQRLAINIGSGARWPKKMLDANQISNLALTMQSRYDVDILLVGGPEESLKAEQILRRCGTARVREALTGSSIAEFIAILSNVDALMCGDTLALHIAGAIGLPTVCVFGPTSAAEIPDYDKLIAKTWVGNLECLGCYGDCAKVDNCMSMFDLEDLVELVHRQLVHRPAAVTMSLS